MTLRVNSEPRIVDRLPFASESSLQRFVREHAEDLLGLKIAAVAERGGGMISKIDLLGVDRSGHVWIIECKLDLVRHRAVDQLQRYRAAVLKRWPRIRTIIAARLGSIRLQDDQQPRLLTIGYRYAPDFVSAKGITQLAYRYHGSEFTAQKFHSRGVGQVSLYRVAPTQVPTQPHPRVSKTDGTLKRLDAPPRISPGSRGATAPAATRNRDARSSPKASASPARRAGRRISINMSPSPARSSIRRTCTR
jgi:hypothetical protein